MSSSPESETPQNESPEWPEDYDSDPSPEEEGHEIEERSEDDDEAQADAQEDAQDNDGQNSSSAPPNGAQTDMGDAPNDVQCGNEQNAAHTAKETEDAALQNQLHDHLQNYLQEQANNSQTVSQDHSNTQSNLQAQSQPAFQSNGQTNDQPNEQNNGAPSAQQEQQDSFQFVPSVRVIDPGPRPPPHLAYSQPRPYQWPPLPTGASPGPPGPPGSQIPPYPSYAPPPPSAYPPGPPTYSPYPPYPAIPPPVPKHMFIGGKKSEIPIPMRAAIIALRCVAKMEYAEIERQTGVNRHTVQNIHKRCVKRAGGRDDFFECLKGLDNGRRPGRPRKVVAVEDTGLLVDGEEQGGDEQDGGGEGDGDGEEQDGEGHGEDVNAEEDGEGGGEAPPPGEESGRARSGSAGEAFRRATGPTNAGVEAMRAATRRELERLERERAQWRRSGERKRAKRAATQGVSKDPNKELSNMLDELREKKLKHEEWWHSEQIREAQRQEKRREEVRKQEEEKLKRKSRGPWVRLPNDDPSPAPVPQVMQPVQPVLMQGPGPMMGMGMGMQAPPGMMWYGPMPPNGYMAVPNGYMAVPIPPQQPQGAWIGIPPQWVPNPPPPQPGHPHAHPHARPASMPVPQQQHLNGMGTAASPVDLTAPVTSNTMNASGAPQNQGAAGNSAGNEAENVAGTASGASPEANPEPRPQQQPAREPPRSIAGGRPKNVILVQSGGEKGMGGEKGKKGNDKQAEGGQGKEKVKAKPGTWDGKA